MRARGALALTFLLALVAALPGCARDAGTPAAAGAPTEAAEAAPPTAEPPAQSGGEVPRGNVAIYFPSASTSGLVTEEREIFVTPTPSDRIKQIVADLLSGPTGEQSLPAVPPGTRLRQAYVVEGGVAYLDFSSELRSMGGGSATEMLTVYAIIDSVVGNVPEVSRVGLLVEGAPIETLNGHMDLRRPLPGDWTLVIPKAI